MQEIYFEHVFEGYRSNLHEFEGYLEYRALLEAADSPKEPSRGRQLACMWCFYTIVLILITAQYHHRSSTYAR